LTIEIKSNIDQIIITNKLKNKIISKTLNQKKMRILKLFKMVIILIVLLFNINLFSQVQYEASIANQTVILSDPTYGNCVYFDIYLRQNGGPGPLYLADSDFRFTFNVSSFTAPKIKYIAGSTVLHNSLGGLTTFYNGNISTSFSSPNKLGINLIGLNINSENEFNHRVAKIDGTPSYHKLGTFVVYTIVNLTGTFGLTWKTGAGGTKVTSMHPYCPWSSCQAIGAFVAIAEQPLPIELTSFTGKVGNGRDVTLYWNTAAENNNKGFDIERSVNISDIWVQVGYVEGKGTISTLTSYTFNDRKLNTGKYKYRLKQIDYNGNFKYYDLNEIFEIGIPNKYDISQNYPNPFNPATNIRYDLPKNGFVKLVVFDALGREIESLVNKKQSAGVYEVTFNAKYYPSGVYFYKLIADGFSDTKKMVLIK
jgi:hypothetical protein